MAVEREEWKFDTLCDLYDTLTITQVLRRCTSFILACIKCPPAQQSLQRLVLRTAQEDACVHMTACR